MKKYLYFTAAAFAALCLASCGQNSETVSENESLNPVIEAIMSRRSIRKYKDTPVGREKLQLIAECGVNAPNGMNAQRWEVRIVDNAETIAAISEEYKKANPQILERDPGFKNMFRNAPAVICIAIPEGDNGIDAGLMGENMILAAQSLGLGTVCLGGPVNFLKNSEPGKEFIGKLGFSQDYSLLYMIGVGYPDESPAAKPRDLGKIKFVD